MIETVQSHSHVICCLVKTTTAPYHMACMACVCVCMHRVRWGA